MSVGIRPERRALSSLYQALDFTDHLRLTEPELGYTVNRSTADENADANRYRDVLAWDHALLPGPYLNAGYIPPFPTTSLSFVASQAPLPETYTVFWEHVVRQRVRVVVNLTPLTEKGRLKSHQYWPDASGSSSAEGSESNAGEMMNLNNGWTVTTNSETSIELDAGNATVVKRLIRISKGQSSSTSAAEGGGDWSVTQFHLLSWPDHGVFPARLLVQLMQETQKVPMPKMYPPPPTWIHCSAGVGRSGTLAAAYIAQAVVNVAQHHNVADAHETLVSRNASAELWDLPVRIVEHLRRYRARMVQTLEQFEAVYEIVAELAEQAKARRESDKQP